MIGLFKIPLISKIALLIKSFKTRATADGGTFEAESCLKTTLTNLKNAQVLEQASLVITPNDVKAGKLYSVIPNDGTGDLNVVRATSATRVNSAGLIETVNNNIARLDYSSGSCPSILVEPQRTNLFLRSEEFNNSSWFKSLGVITQNSIISPNGTITADLFTKTSGISTVSQITNSNLVYATTGIHTLSVYLKPNVGNAVLLRLDNSGNTANFTFNFTTKTFTNSGVNVISSSYEELKDGWLRLKVTGNVTSTSWRTSPCNLYLNPTGDAMWIWGAQLEAGSNATSYIPTTTSSVTRNADIMTLGNLFTKNIVTSSGGSWYIELLDSKPLVRTLPSYNFYIGDSTSGDVGNSFNLRNNASFSETLTIDKFINGVRTGLINVPIGNTKILINWNGSTANIFINGAKVISNTTFSATNLQFLSLGGQDVSKNIKNIMIYPFPLTDQQAIQFTTL